MAELLNPTITIHNTTGNYLVRLQHDFGNGEALDATIFIARGNHTVGTVSQMAIDRLQELLQAIRPAD